MRGVLTWKQPRQLRVRGCSLCGWIYSEPAGDTATLARAEAFRRIEAAFTAHDCKDYPNDSSACLQDEGEGRADREREGQSCLVLPPLDRIVLGTDSGYWQVRVVSAHRTPHENLLLTLSLKRDVDGERIEVRTLRLHISLAELDEPRWQSRLCAKVRDWIENTCGSGCLKIDSLVG